MGAVQKNLIITNGTIIADQLIPNGTVVALKDKILFVGDEAEGKKIRAAADPRAFEIIDAQGGYIAPGLIDVHMHGSAGSELMEGTDEAVSTMARFVLKHGVVGFLPSTVTATKENTGLVAQLIADYEAADDEAEVLGIHLEGPYVNDEYKGAQYGPAIRRADLAELENLYDILGDKLRVITLAPEVPGGAEAIDWLRKRGVAVSMGHTAATDEQACDAFKRGVTRVTHTFNAMPGLHHRAPGTVGAALTTPGIYAELIADFVHVHPAVIRIMLECIGCERIVLVSDAVQATGLEDGEYVLGDHRIFVKEGAARLSDGTLAGSTLTLLRAVRNMIDGLGVAVVDAFRMASLNPALSIGLVNKGWIREGNEADFVLLSPTYEVLKTIIGGRVAYSKN